MAAVNGAVEGMSSTKNTTTFTNKVTVVLGAQWGDEGKGKVVDMLSSDVDVVCRCQVIIIIIIIFDFCVMSIIFFLYI